MTPTTQPFTALGSLITDFVFLPTGEVDHAQQKVRGIVTTSYMHAELDLSVSLVPVTDGTTSIKDLTSKWEKDPRKAAALARARQRVGANLGEEPLMSLTQLRLSKGLSQTALANLMECKQPYIARIENGDDDVKMSTVEKLSVAFEVSQEDIFRIISTMRKARAVA